MLWRCRANAVGLGQQIQHWRHDQGARERTDAEHQLLLPRCGTNQITGLEILQVIAAHRRRTAHHRADHDGRHCTQRRGTDAHRHQAALAEQQYQHRRGEQDGGDGDARHRVIGRADQAGQIARHRHEQEAGHDHDDGHRDRHMPLLHDGLIQAQQRQGAQHQRHQHPLHRQIALGLCNHTATALARGGKTALDPGKTAMCAARTRSTRHRSTLRRRRGSGSSRPRCRTPHRQPTHRPGSAPGPGPSP